MRKRFLSMLLALAMLISALPVTAYAEKDTFAFMNDVTFELPVVTEGEFLAGDVELPKQTGTDFIGELSGDMPKVRKDGFLKEPTAPLKSFPESGTLIEEVGEPDPAATPIGTAAELAAMKSNGNYYLAADIDLTGMAWKPVGGKNFTLDGQGHVITGLTPTAETNQYYIGLFGKVENLTVRNLIIQDYTATTFSHYRYLGVLVGYVQSYSAGSLVVENCIMEDVNITVDGSWNNAKISGLAGFVDIKGDTAFRACAVSGTVSYAQEAYDLNQYGCMAYGMVCEIKAKSLKMEDCLSQIRLSMPEVGGGGTGMTGNVKCETVDLLRCVSSCETNRGYSGMLGTVTASTSITMTDCVFDGSVRNAQGGMIHTAKSPIVTLDNCRTEGSLYDLRGGNYLIGGMIGYVTNCKTLTVDHCLAASDISMTTIANDSVGGLIGVCDGGTFTDCLSTGNITVKEDITGLLYSGGLLANGEGGLLEMLRCENLGTIQGSTAGGLVGYMGESNYSTANFEDCRNSGEILATYDTASVGGLLGLGSGDVTNCVSTGNVTGETAGGFVGTGCGNVKDCRVKAEITTNSRAGGLRGLAMKGGPYTIENCAVTLHVNATDGGTVGGLSGLNYGVNTVKNCTVDFSVSGNSEYAGGFFGSVNGTANAIDSCSDIKIENGEISGGFVGRVSSGNLNATNCFAQVDIENAREYVGGLLGEGSYLLSRCYVFGELKSVHNNAGRIGGLVGYGSGTIGQCWTNVEITGGDLAGGLGGMISGTIYGSWASGDLKDWTDLDEENDAAGGLVGSASKAAIQDCCYTGKLERQNTDVVGGLIGSGSGMMRNCYYEGDITCENNTNYTIGGLVGSSSMDIYDCRYAGTIDGMDAGSYVGGIVGMGSGNLENCIAQGSVTGGYTGGIAGELYPGNIISCVSDMTVDGTSYVGGYVGWIKGNIEDCHYNRPLYSKTAIALGGIAGNLIYSVLKNCSAQDVFLNHNAGIDSFRTVGGIAGGAGSTSILENCKVYGNVLFAARDISNDAVLREFNIGGLVGTAYEDLYTNYCTVNGSVRGYVTADNTEGRRKMHIGGLCGYASILYVESSAFFGNVSYGSYAVHKHRLLGDKVVVDGSLQLVPLEKKNENYQVKIISFDPQTGITSLLEGAEIKVDGVSLGYTDEFGLLGFDSTAFTSTGLVTISADLEGYFHGETVTYLADGGMTTIALEKKVPGQLYIKSAYHIKNGVTTEVLSGYNKLRISQIDTGYSQIMAGVDWNDLDEENRTIRLVGEKGTSVVYLNENGYGMASFANMFEPDEAVYIIASGTYNGETVSKRQKLYVSVKEIDASIPTPTGDMELGGTQVPGDKDSKTILYFLNGLNIKVKLGDLTELGPDVTYKNGILTIKVSTDDVDDAKEKLQKISVFDKRTDKVEVSGEFSIPITDLYEGEWSGSMTASINGGHQLEVDEKKRQEYNDSVAEELQITYNFVVGPGIPCYLETSLSAGGEVTLKVAGSRDDGKVEGELKVTGTAEFGGGIGHSFNDNLEAKAGAYGDLTATIPMNYTFLGDFDLDPSLSGGLGLKISAKAYEALDVEAKLKLGGFDWDKDGVVWSLLGKKYDSEGNPIQDIEDPSMGGRSLSLNSMSCEWTEVSRDYLENGGGFQTEDAGLLSFSGEEGSTLRYKNISYTSDAVMAAENGQPVLYFTADDGAAGSEGVAKHTVLYRTVQQADGSWSEPEAMTSAADGYPAMPDAQNGFVAWVNSEETSDLDAMLSSTDIQVFDGTTVTTFEGNGYVLSPKLSVSADGTGAMLCWLSDPEVTSADLLGGDTMLYYATYENGVWGEAVQVKTSSVPVYAEPKYASKAIYYIAKDGSLYRGTSSYSDSSGYTNRTDLCDGITATVNELNQLVIKDGNSCLLTQNTDWSGGEAPVITYDSLNKMYYVFWAENGAIRYVRGSKTSWSEPLFLTATRGAPSGLRAAVANGVPTVSYYQTIGTSDGARTDLYTVVVDPAGVDLVLEQLDYSVKDLVDNGYVTLQASVFNNGLGDANGAVVSVTDEEGNIVYSQTHNIKMASGSVNWIYPVFSFDGKVHTYTLEVQPIKNGAQTEDADGSDNALSLQVGTANASIADTCFLSDDGSNIKLQAMVRNTGGVSLDDLTVEIGTIDGDVLKTVSYIGEDNAVPVGSYRQVLLEQIQPNICYQVTVRSGEEVLDTEMLIYEDIHAASLGVRNVSVTQDGEATLTVSGQNLDLTGAQLVLALYQEGQMKASGMTAVTDLNQTQKLTVEVSDTLKKGSYSYKLFFLAEDGSMTPIWKPCEGSVRVSK